MKTLEATHCPGSKNTVIGMLLVIGLAFSGCASTSREKSITCCAGIGLDISNLTGASGIDCGLIDSWIFPESKNRAKKRAAKRAIQCAKNAESKGIPFMLNKNVVIPPDVSYSLSYIFTQTGEKVLLQVGEWGDSGLSVGVSKCSDVHVELNGEIKEVNCADSREIYEQLQQRQ